MINFHTESIDFKVLNPIKTKRWLRSVIESEGFELLEINYIFCNDEYLHTINVEYLEHDTLTDIITFDNSEEEQLIEGDIFVSIERIIDNTKDFSAVFNHAQALYIAKVTLANGITTSIKLVNQN